MALDTTISRSRRALLAGAFGGLAGVAAQALRPLTTRAEGETIHVGDDHHTATTATWLKNTTTNNDVFRAETTRAGRGVYGISDSGPGVEGKSAEGVGVDGTSTETIGVRGRSENFKGVVGIGRTGGVTGQSNGGSGVYGSSISGVGVFGSSMTNHAIVGESAADDGASVHGRKRAGHAGNAVFGEIQVTGSASSAVVGETAGTGNGIRGTSAHGRGGRFQGPVAQIRLDPADAATHPASGARGDLFVDRSGRLWFCKGGTTWKQIA